MNNNVLNLMAYRQEHSRMFSGREHGLEVREALGLDEKDKDSMSYTIQIDDEILAVNSSFFGGLFSESVISLGKEIFEKKYIFKNEHGKDVKETIRRDIEEGIYDAVNC